MKKLLLSVTAMIAILPLHAEEIVTAEAIYHALAPKRSMFDTKAQRQNAFSEKIYRELNPGLDPANRGIRIIATADGQQATVTVDQSATISFDSIRFKFDSTELADEFSERQLKEIARSLAEQKDKSFLLEGHTCELGEKDHNKDLSERRAKAVGLYLRANGVSCEFVVFGFGENEPRAENSSEVSRAKNRRVVIRLKS